MKGKKRDGKGRRGNKSKPLAISATDFKNRKRDYIKRNSKNQFVKFFVDEDDYNVSHTMVLVFGAQGGLLGTQGHVVPIFPQDVDIKPLMYPQPTEDRPHQDSSKYRAVETMFYREY